MLPTTLFSPMEGLETGIRKLVFIDPKRHQNNAHRLHRQLMERPGTAWSPELYYQNVPPPDLLVFLPLTSIQTFLLVHLLKHVTLLNFILHITAFSNVSNQDNKA